MVCMVYEIVYEKLRCYKVGALNYNYISHKGFLIK